MKHVSPTGVSHAHVSPVCISQTGDNYEFLKSRCLWPVYDKYYHIQAHILYTDHYGWYVTHR